jgi:hypothetical protein
MSEVAVKLPRHRNSAIAASQNKIAGKAASFARKIDIFVLKLNEDDKQCKQYE